MDAMCAARFAREIDATREASGRSGGHFPGRDRSPPRTLGTFVALLGSWSSVLEANPEEVDRDENYFGRPRPEMTEDNTSSRRSSQDIGYTDTCAYDGRILPGGEGAPKDHIEAYLRSQASDQGPPTKSIYDASTSGVETDHSSTASGGTPDESSSSDSLAGSYSGSAPRSPATSDTVPEAPPEHEVPSDVPASWKTSPATTATTCPSPPLSMCSTASPPPSSLPSQRGPPSPLASERWHQVAVGAKERGGALSCEFRSLEDEMSALNRDLRVLRTFLPSQGKP